MGDVNKCADCGCNLLVPANDCPMLGFAEGILVVRRATGKHVFICGRCADERYEAGQITGC